MKPRDYGLLWRLVVAEMEGFGRHGFRRWLLFVDFWLIVDGVVGGTGAGPPGARREAVHARLAS
jgi:hypothetical protein